MISAEEVFELRFTTPTGSRFRPGRSASKERARSGCGTSSRRACGCAPRGSSSGRSGRGVSRPPACPQRRVPGHGLAPREQRPRGAREDVHVAAAGRREHRCPVRRPHGRLVGGPRRPPRDGRTWCTPGQRDRRRSGSCRNDTIETEVVFRREGDRLVRATGMPPRLERFERAAIDVHALLNGVG